MRYFVTRIKAICPIDGTLKNYIGQNIKAKSFDDAVAYCQNNGLGYCEVIGVLTDEIDTETGEINNFE